MNEQEREQQRAFPERKCEVSGDGCKGAVTVFWEHQLCRAHVDAFEAALWGNMPGRVGTWVERVRGGQR